MSRLCCGQPLVRLGRGVSSDEVEFRQRAYTWIRHDPCAWVVLLKEAAICSLKKTHTAGDSEEFLGGVGTLASGVPFRGTFFLRSCRHRSLP